MNYGNDAWRLNTRSFVVLLEKYALPQAAETFTTLCFWSVCLCRLMFVLCGTCWRFSLWIRKARKVTFVKRL